MVSEKGGDYQVDSLLEVKVWGDFACFTRPEMKVERVSYPLITPSAARGVLEAIFWKPEFRWQVREIWALKPINYFSMVRNEVSSKVAVSSVRKWAGESGGYFVEDDRTQRHTLGLRDVAYVIRAEQVLSAHAEDLPIAKYRDQFRRRVANGRCFYRPYLGCREFSANFSPVGPGDRPILHSEKLGRMLFDLNYDADESGRGTPVFFQAELLDGVLKVPPELYA